MRLPRRPLKITTSPPPPQLDPPGRIVDRGKRPCPTPSVDVGWVRDWRGAIRSVSSRTRGWPATPPPAGRPAQHLADPSAPAPVAGVDGRRLQRAPAPIL